MTGQSFQTVSSDAWWTRVERSLITGHDNATLLDATSDNGELSADFLALASALVPRDEAGQKSVSRWLGRSWSTVQLRDRLQRQARTSPNPAVYHDILEELAVADVERTDKALAVSFKWASQEAKRIKKAAGSLELPTKRSRDTPTSSSQAQTMVLHNSTSNDVTVAGVADLNLKGWIMNTPALAFISLLLYILLGDGF